MVHPKAPLVEGGGKGGGETKPLTKGSPRLGGYLGERGPLPTALDGPRTVTVVGVPRWECVVVRCLRTVALPCGPHSVASWRVPGLEHRSGGNRRARSILRWEMWRRLRKKALVPHFWGAVSRTKKGPMREGLNEKGPQT